MMDVLLVFTNMPDMDSAHQLAAHLIDERLAACVNILSPCTSVYRWQGVTETTTEVPLLIKCHTSRYVELEAAIRKHHPYELPEIVAVNVDKGLPAYLSWVAQETAPPA